MRILPILGAAMLTMTVAAGPARGIPMMPETVPVDRLVQMGEEALRKKPEDAEAEYTLARIHYLAFACGATKLEAYLKTSGERLMVGPFQKWTEPNQAAVWREAERRALAEMKLEKRPPYDSEKGKRYWARMQALQREMEAARWKPEDLPDPESVTHIEKAMAHFEKAMRLAPKNALYRLGYASLLEQAREWAQRHPKGGASEFIQHLAVAAVREEYRKAWAMELPADLKDKERGMFSLLDMVSYESGKSFVRLAEAGGSGLSAEEAKTLTKVRASLKELEQDRMMAVTPVIFALRPSTSIAELLAPETVVEFPLRGWGPAGRWPWVKPETALLVWNPSRSGRVVSGAQLFGSYTWELFWKTGYDALAVLDTNGDGELTGAELDGLAAWRDANSNGVSDPGEVQPLAELGVVALAVAATSAEGPQPMNAAGLTVNDGRKLPTWDWVVESLPPADTADDPTQLARADP